MHAKNYVRKASVHYNRLWSITEPLLNCPRLHRNAPFYFDTPDVLWSDETKRNLFVLDRGKRVWRQPGEDYKDKCVLPTAKHGRGSVLC